MAFSISTYPLLDQFYGCIYKFLIKVPDSSFILIIATLENYQSTKLSIADLGGVERYHRLDLVNISILQEELCVNKFREVAIKSIKIKLSFELFI